LGVPEHFAAARRRVQHWVVVEKGWEIRSSGRGLVKDFRQTRREKKGMMIPYLLAPWREAYPDVLENESRG